RRAGSKRRDFEWAHSDRNRALGGYHSTDITDGGGGGGGGGTDDKNVLLTRGITGKPRAARDRDSSASKLAASTLAAADKKTAAAVADLRGASTHPVGTGGLRPRRGSPLAEAVAVAVAPPPPLPPPPPLETTRWSYPSVGLVSSDSIPLYPHRDPARPREAGRSPVVGRGGGGGGVHGEDRPGMA
ncbi:unnamed protein product, partial [Laminaria digitata]